MQQEEYQALRNSNDHILRNYRWDARRRGIETCTQGTRNKSRIAALIGIKVKVYVFSHLSI